MSPARWLQAGLLTYIAACGKNEPRAGDDGGGGGGGDAGGGGGTDGGSGVVVDDLESPSGCDGVYNPDQILTYHITVGGDFTGIEMDDYGPGTFACGDETPLRVGVKPRHAGEGWMIDVNWAVQGQHFRDLKKLSFHTGAGFDPTIEYLAWRVQRLAGNGMFQRSALAHVYVDGVDQGLLFNLEQLDKRFLESRLGDGTGWLYKKSGIDDGYRTNETIANPYEAEWCIFAETQPCAPPADLETWLPAHLAMEQFMRMGAGNVLLGNSDGPLSKPHNFYTYDYAGGPRYYWPWDLDSSWGQETSAFNGPGGSTFEDVLFIHWEDDYAALLRELLAGPLSVASVQAELDRAVATGGVDAGQVAGMKSWYAGHAANVLAEANAH